MRNALRAKLGRHWIPVPQWIWQRTVARHARSIAAGLDFMSVDHHRIRNFAVEELSRAGEPLPPELISDRLGVPLGRVVAVLDELERKLTFVFRNDEGAVTWAYPVTVDATPHHLSFETGERMTAA